MVDAVQTVTTSGPVVVVVVLVVSVLMAGRLVLGPMVEPVCFRRLLGQALDEAEVGQTVSAPVHLGAVQATPETVHRTLVVAVLVAVTSALVVLAVLESLCFDL
jgi:predicted thioredoxin/glutaredoxin